MILAFTGHRPEKLGGYNPGNPTELWVRELIRAILELLTPNKIISGMALGVDQWAAEEAIKLGILFVAAVPFDDFEKKWPAHSINQFNYLLTQSSEIHYISEPGYAAWKMQRRNEWIVDHSDALVAIWDGSFSGTKNCIDYAKHKKKPIYNLNPVRTTC